MYICICFAAVLRVNVYMYMFSSVFASIGVRWCVDLYVFISASSVRNCVCVCACMM